MAHRIKSETPDEEGGRRAGGEKMHDVKLLTKAERVCLLVKLDPDFNRWFVRLMKKFRRKFLIEMRLGRIERMYSDEEIEKMLGWKD